MNLSEALQATARVLAALEALGVDCLLGGSLASSLHGTPRATQDADLVADLREEDAAGLVRLLGSEFYADELMIREAIRARRSFNVVHLPTMFKVDVFVLRHDPLSLSEMARREILSLPDGLRLPVASAEDIVLQKLLWFRLGEGVSERQWRDVVGVLTVLGERIDGAYLEHWAAREGLSDLLEAARKEAGGI